MTSPIDQRDTSPQAKMAAGALLALVAFTIPFPIRVNAIASIAALILAIAAAFVHRAAMVRFFRSPLFILVAAHFIVLVIGLMHTDQMSQGYAILERYLNALMLLLVVYLLSGYSTTPGSTIAGFVGGCLTITLFGFLYAFFFVEAEERSQILSQGHLLFADNIHIHPFYLSLFLIFIFFFLTEVLRTDSRWRQPSKLMTIATGLVIVTIMIIFLRSQIALLIFLLLVVLYVMVVYKRRAALLTFFLFSIGLIVYLTDTRRVATFVDSYGKNVSTAIENRHQVWSGTLAAIADHPLAGAGTGDAQESLKNGYSRIGYQEGIDNEYNAHNQYLEFVVRNGILELAAFLALLVYAFRQALRQTNYLFLMFLMLFSLGMLAESALNVQKGIVFFYFFLAVFIYLPAATARQHG